MAATASAPLSKAALARVRRPRTRGAFMPVDAARRQLGLLAVSDPLGQARLSWLVDLGTQVIEDARFLAFGSLASHALADAFTETARGRTVADACRLTVEQIEALLRDDPVTPACDPAETAFIPELQRLAEAELPRLVLLPKPAEVPAYERKRQQDWDERDRAWLPLSLLKKYAKADAVAARVLRERLGQVPKYELGVHHDLELDLQLEGVPEDQHALLGSLIQDAAHSELHPGIRVTARAKGPAAKATP